MTEPEKLELTSLDVAAEKRAQLLCLFPEIRTEGGKLDFDRLRSALGESVDVGRERYGLVWPGKAECFKAIQAPSLGTLRPALQESVNFDTTKNLIIEGDNLEVLKLLQKSYLGHISLIYIDPPYNTGGEFIYPDNFGETLQTYLEYTGQVDVEGRRFGTNTESEGRFHSKWLNMMYPRLYLARNLLEDEGLIFVSIDECEVVNLRALLDTVFGEDNFICQVSVQSNPRGRQSEIIATTHEYVVIYAKDASKSAIGGQALDERQASEYRHSTGDGRKYRLRGLRHRGNASRRVDRPKMFFPIYVNPHSRAVSLDQSDEFPIEVLPRKSTGEDGRWEWGKDTVKGRLDRLEAVFVETRDEWDIHQREFLEFENGESKRTKWKSIWDEKEINYQNGSAELKDLFGISPIEYPKPKYLLSKIISGASKEDGIVLDFFAGSGTTAHAVLELNRQSSSNRRFIVVQLPEPTGREDFPTIADITKERVRRVIQKFIEEDAAKLDLEDVGNLDRGFRVFKLAESSFKPWNADAPKDATELGRQLELHVEHIREGRSSLDLLYEILLKSGFPLTTPIETLTLADTLVFSVSSGALLICLERKLTLALIRAMAELSPERVVCLDEGFAGNDQLKTNAVQTFRTKGVKKFQTV